MRPVPPLSAYPFQEIITPRFSDLDMAGCLSSVAQLSIFEEANRSARRRMTSSKRPGRGVIAQHTVSYLSPGTYPEAMTLAAAVIRIGNCSYEMQHLLTQAGRPVSVCNIVSVYLGEEGRPTPLPPDFRQDMEAWLLDTGEQHRQGA